MRKKNIFITAGVTMLFAGVALIVVFSHGHNKNNQATDNTVVADYIVNETQINDNTESSSEKHTQIYAEETSESSESTHNEIKEPDSTQNNTEKDTETETHTECMDEDVDFSQLVSDSINISFTLRKLSTYDDYANMGYEKINDVNALSDYANSILNNNIETSKVFYIITPNGLFDSLSEEMNVHKKNATDGTAKSIYERDVFLYDKLGLNYQEYSAKGIVLFLFNKIEDSTSGDASVYALYYYTYENQNQIEKVIEKTKYVAEIIKTDNEYDNILAAHDYICNNTEYASAEEEDIAVYHSAYGVFFAGKAVCEGYARAYKLLLDQMNIECEIVYSNDHAWNIVKYNNQWYVVDLTNDDASGKDCHGYFLLGRDVMYHTGGSMVIDGYVVTEDTISRYGYINGTNTGNKNIADNTYNHTTRIGK